jgi:3-isopropylmalate/(R)-2-methylmalate dehydratase small subunit
VAAPEVGLEGVFRLDDAMANRLLLGLDDVGVTLGHLAAIEAYEASRPDWLPSAR